MLLHPHPRCPWVLQSFYWILQSFYWVLQSFYWVLQSFYWILQGLASLGSFRAQGVTGWAQHHLLVLSSPSYFFFFGPSTQLFKLQQASEGI